MRLGINYKGSKNRIARKIIDLLPPAETFIDLFAGGCAVTHAAMLSGKYKRFIMNDIDGRGIRVFTGEYKAKPSDWISREMFFKNSSLPVSDQDAFIACEWSFSGNMKDYLYGKHLEDWKHAYHEAVYDRDLSRWNSMGFYPPECDITNTNQRRLFYMRKIREMGEPRNHWELESAEGLPTFKPSMYVYYTVDYQAIRIPSDAVIYCDPPYNGTNTGGYDTIKHEQFYEWLRHQTVPCFVSEYSMPDDFKVVCEWGLHALSDTSGSGRMCKEKLWTL